MHVEHFMTKNPVACDADDTIEHVAKLMRDKGVGSVVVLRDERVAGIVTDRQIAVEGVAQGVGADDPVSQVMTENPARLTLEDNIFSVVDTMRSAGVVRRVPVVDAENRLIGVVSISDVAVIAKDLIDAVLLEASHTAMEETSLLTGAKRIVKDIRRPTKMDRLPPEQEIQAVTAPSPSGASESGGAGRPPPPARQKSAPSPSELRRED